MATAGITLLLDLHECQSLALTNAGLLEQLVVNALQFAGLEVVEQSTRRFPHGTVVMCILRDAQACLRVLPQAALVAVDVSALGKPETTRAALEIVRGYLTQKLIARSVQAHWVERGEG